jgi:hypothetical protein
MLELLPSHLGVSDHLLYYFTFLYYLTLISFLELLSVVTSLASQSDVIHHRHTLALRRLVYIHILESLPGESWYTVSPVLLRLPLSHLHFPTP